MASQLDLQSWSKTPANNGNSDGGINFLENQARASLNDSCRAMMATHAITRDLTNGSITTGGTSAAQTFTSGVTGYTSVPSGLVVRLKIGPANNSGAVTLNMDALGAIAVVYANGSALLAGALAQNSICEFVYNGTNWIFLTPTPTPIVPTIQVFLSGSGTYTTPASVKWLEVRMCGGGSGGNGGDTGAAGSAGGNTTFSTLTANGGSSAGGTASGGSINLTGAVGGDGSGGSTTSFGVGGMGAASPFGGGGGGGNFGVGKNAPVNTGAGGGGGGANLSKQGGTGGCAGGYCEALISAPSASYSYAVGASGGGGVGAGGGSSGGAGGSGLIIVKEHYI